MVILRKLIKDGKITEEQLFRIGMPFGMLILLVSLILGQFAPDVWQIDFLIGLFSGMSIIVNLTFLVMFGRNQRKKQEIAIKASS